MIISSCPLPSRRMWLASFPALSGRGLQPFLVFSPVVPRRNLHIIPESPGKGFLILVPGSLRSLPDASPLHQRFAGPVHPHSQQIPGRAHMEASLKPPAKIGPVQPHIGCQFIYGGTVISPLFQVGEHLLHPAVHGRLGFDPLSEAF